MASIIASNITSPLGLTTEETYSAVRAGQLGLKHYPCNFDGKGWKDLPFDVEASLFSDDQWQTIQTEGYTRFESAVLYSVRDALRSVKIEKSKTIFILSSTKGDIENLDRKEEVSPLGTVARKISKAIGITNEPIAVCNACISGVSALILAQRLVDQGYYDYAIVCGADIQSRFIVSGFQSFKALSVEPCRPFDIERLGLNLGEAAATVVLGREGREGWSIVKGSVRNDAYHISAPHPKGDGACLALETVTEGIESGSLAVLGVHGTATMYNDQMESKAIERAGLLNVPLSALKGYFGHTMGAAGVLETILTARALDDGIILPSKGFSMRGVSGKVSLSDKEQKTDRHTFVKMLSGFGGCNGAVVVSQKAKDDNDVFLKTNEVELKVVADVKITPHDILLNGERISSSSVGKEMLTELYKTKVGDYPKYYKMDVLSRLAFIAAELLIKAEGSERGVESIEHSEDRAIVLFNQSSSIIADRHYEESIVNNEEFYPSPAAFVYTLPNITTGEIAIRHGYHGETSFYVLPERDERIMEEVLTTTFADTKTKSVIGGWIDCVAEDSFECELKIYHKE